MPRKSSKLRFNPEIYWSLNKLGRKHYAKTHLSRVKTADEEYKQRFVDNGYFRTKIWILSCSNKANNQIEYIKMTFKDDIAQSVEEYFRNDVELVYKIRFHRKTSTARLKPIDADWEWKPYHKFVEKTLPPPPPLPKLRYAKRMTARDSETVTQASRKGRAELGPPGPVDGNTHQTTTPSPSLKQLIKGHLQDMQDAVPSCTVPETKQPLLCLLCDTRSPCACSLFDDFF